MKTQVYSWRVSAGLKSDLERMSRRKNTSVSAVLTEAAREWLAKAEVEAAEEQTRLHAAAAEFIGSIRGGDRNRAANASRLVREQLRRRYAR